MATGTVKWFNAQRALASSNLTRAATTFSYIAAVERAGLGSLHEGQKISYELEKDGRSGKPAARPTGQRLMRPAVTEFGRLQGCGRVGLGRPVARSAL